MDMELKFISTTKKNDAIHPLPEGRGLLAKKDKKGWDSWKRTKINWE
jgi:hypothetical protein